MSDHYSKMTANGPLRSRLASMVVAAFLVAVMTSDPVFAQQAPNTSTPEATQPDTQTDGQAPPAAQPSGPPDPIQEIIKSANIETTRGRAELRDNLYALLATASDEATAKRIATEIEKLWSMPGSATVLVLMQRANAAMKEKNNDLALQFLDAAVDLAPDYAEAWNRRAYVYFQSGDLRRAVGDLRRALALDPNHYRALEGLGNIMRSTDDEAAALKAYERLIDVHPFADGAQKAYEDLRQRVEGRGI